MEISKKTVRNLVIGALLCIVANWLLNEPERFKVVFYTVWDIILPFIAGAGVAFVLNVPMRGIEGWFKFVKISGLRRAIAIVLTFIFVLLVISGVLWILIPQISQTVHELIEKLPDFGNWVVSTVQKGFEDNPQILGWVQDNFGQERITELTNNLVNYLQTSLPGIWNGTISIVKDLSTGIFNAVVALVFAVYCLARKEILARQARRLLYSFVPEKISDITVRILRLTNATFSNFISGQCIEAVILGSLFAIAMLIFGMPYIDVYKRQGAFGAGAD